MMYYQINNSAIAFGDPVGDNKSSRELIWNFKEMTDLKNQQALANKIESTVLSIQGKMSEGNTLYAAIGPQVIISELARKGIRLDKNQIDVKQIKEAGEYKAKVKLRHGLEALLSITVFTK